MTRFRVLATTALLVLARSRFGSGPRSEAGHRSHAGKSIPTSGSTGAARWTDGAGLNQINKNNVNQLQLVWSWGLRPGKASGH
jgi:hypothetical protein